MAKPVNQYILEILQTYQDLTHKTCSVMALDFDITLSNLYQYRNGTGNPTGKTIDKIVRAAEENCPEALGRYP